MTTASDTFTGDNPTGLGTTEVGALPWINLTGSWRRASGKAVCDTARTSNPLVVVDVNTPNVDVSANVGTGGDAIYFRVQDASNWLRLRANWGTSSYWVSSGYWTDSGYYEYSYAGTIYHDSSMGTHTGIYSGSASPSSAYFDIGWQTSSPNPYYHYVSHSHSGGGSHYHEYSGNLAIQSSRYVDTSYYTDTSHYEYYDTYSVVLEKCVAGTISTIWTYDMSSTAVTSLRVDVSLNSIGVYVNGSLKNTVTDSSFSTQTKHGIGRGASSNDSGGDDIDNFSITYSSQYGWGVPI